MNDDLFGRAVEAAAIAAYESVASQSGDDCTWLTEMEAVRVMYRLEVEPIVRAVFGVIADHCDERRVVVLDNAFGHGEGFALTALTSELRETNE